MLFMGKGLELGASIPSVSGTDQDGKPIALDEYCADGYALVFFFPKAETSGCVAQACSLRDAFDALSARDVKVLGVSQDSVRDQKKFRENRNLPYPLIADKKKTVIDAFGVPSAFGLTKRQAYLFRDGRLVWKDQSASTTEQAADVLAYIESQ